jgi:uncharacterized delta-60 repeat protein
VKSRYLKLIIFFFFVWTPGCTSNDSLIGSFSDHPSSGTIDNDFADQGKLIIDLGSGDDQISKIIHDSQGRLVVAGRVESDTNSFDVYIARFNADGSFDTTFSSDGYHSFDIANGQDAGLTLTIDTQSRILVAGRAASAGSNILVARFLENGNLDSSFDSDGIVITNVTGANESALDITILSDDSAVVVGQATGTAQDFLILKYLPSGTLDTSFDTDGIFTLDISAGVDTLTSVFSFNNSIYASGYSSNGTDLDAHLFKIDLTGTVDASFGVSGHTKIDIGGNNDAYSSIKKHGNYIYAVGFSNSGSFKDALVSRFHLSGELDTSFGDNGHYTYAASDSLDNQFKDIVIDSKGNAYICGFTQTSTNFYGVLLKLNSEGALDTTWGDSGLISHIEESLDVSFDSVSTDALNRIIVTGYITNGSDKDILVMRYWP